MQCHHCSPYANNQDNKNKFSIWCTQSDGGDLDIAVGDLWLSAPRQSREISILWVRHRNSKSNRTLCVRLGGLQGTNSYSLVIDTEGKDWLEVALEALRSSYSSKGQFSTVSNEEKGCVKTTIPGVVMIKLATPQCVFMEIAPCRETETICNFWLCLQRNVYGVILNIL